MTIFAVFELFVIIFLLTRASRREYYQEPWDDMDFWMTRLRQQDEYIVEAEAGGARAEVLKSARAVRKRILRHLERLEVVCG